VVRFAWFFTTYKHAPIILLCTEHCLTDLKNAHIGARYLQTEVRMSVNAAFPLFVWGIVLMKLVLDGFYEGVSIESTR
jgi:hypothetical protein